MEQNQMELAHKEMIFGNYESAVVKYSKCIDANPKTDLYLFRAICYINLTEYDKAIKDLDECEKQSNADPFQVHFNYGIALFHKNDFKQSLAILKHAESLAKLEYEKTQIAVWKQKVNAELGDMPASLLNGVAVVPEKEGAKVEEIKVKQEASNVPEIKKRPEYDWYQNKTHVYCVLKLKNMDKEKCDIAIEPREFTFSCKQGETVYQHTFNLANEIIADQSTQMITEKKVEIKLKKKDEAAQWSTFEAITQEAGKDRPLYPSSSKKKVDWDKLETQIKRETQKEKPEGDEALNTLIKAIYEKADEDTRRAIIKSYQTSGGTVLSTNWKEVKDKDYAGKDRPEPPKGQEWRKPEY